MYAKPNRTLLFEIKIILKTKNRAPLWQPAILIKTRRFPSSGLPEFGIL